MKECLRMSDVFPDGVYVGTEEWMNGWFEVRHVGGSSIDESCDGGYSERDANYVSRAINSHDELVAEADRLRDAMSGLLSLTEHFAECGGWDVNAYAEYKKAKGA